MRWKPHPYQLRSAKFLVENPHGALCLDPGLGKTGTVLMTFKALRKAERHFQKGGCLSRFDLPVIFNHCYFHACASFSCSPYQIRSLPIALSASSRCMLR